MTTGPAVRGRAGILDAAHRRLSVGIVATVVFIAFEAMAVATAMPKAVSELRGVPLYALAFSAYFTTSLVGMVLAGEASDRRGPLRPLLTGAGFFVAGLIVAGAAQSMWPFVIGRATQGLGGGLVIVALYVVVGRSYDGSLRPRLFAAMSAGWVVPSIVGPLIAGVFADHLSWRWVFLGIAPLVVVPIGLVLPTVRVIRPVSTGSGARRSRIGLAVVVATGMGLLQYAGTDLGIAALVMAAVAVVLLVPSVPRLLPPGTLLLRFGLPTVVAMRGIIAGAFFGAEVFLPLLLVTERGLSSTLAGLSLTGGSLGWAAGSGYQGRSKLTVPRHLLVRYGCLLVACGIAGLGLLLVPAVPFWVATLIWTFGAAGMGMAMASISVLLFQLSPVAEQGANSSAMQLSDAMFSIVFVGLAGTIFGSAHGSAAGAAVVPAWVFGTILAMMVTLALFGAWAAGRMRAHDPATNP